MSVYCPTGGICQKLVQKASQMFATFHIWLDMFYWLQTCSFSIFALISSNMVSSTLTSSLFSFVSDYIKSNYVFPYCEQGYAQQATTGIRLTICATNVLLGNINLWISRNSVYHAIPATVPGALKPSTPLNASVSWQLWILIKSMVTLNHMALESSKTLSLRTGC